MNENKFSSEFRIFYDKIHDDSGDEFFGNYTFHADVDYQTDNSVYDRTFQDIQVLITFNEGRNQSISFLGNEFNTRVHHTEFTAKYIQAFKYDKTANTLIITAEANSKKFTKYKVTFSNIYYPKTEK
jgi:hypothetical protein